MPKHHKKMEEIYRSAFIASKDLFNPEIINKLCQSQLLNITPNNLHRYLKDKQIFLTFNPYSKKLIQDIAQAISKHNFEDGRVDLVLTFTIEYILSLLLIDHKLSFHNKLKIIDHVYLACDDLHINGFNVAYAGEFGVGILTYPTTPIDEASRKESVIEIINRSSSASSLDNSSSASASGLNNSIKMPILLLSESETLQLGESEALQPSESETLQLGESETLQPSESETLQLGKFETLQLVESEAVIQLGEYNQNRLLSSDQLEGSKTIDLDDAIEKSRAKTQGLINNVLYKVKKIFAYSSRALTQKSTYLRKEHTELCHRLLESSKIALLEIDSTNEICLQIFKCALLTKFLESTLTCYAELSVLDYVISQGLSLHYPRSIHAELRLSLLVLKQELLNRINDSNYLREATDDQLQTTPLSETSDDQLQTTPLDETSNNQLQTSLDIQDPHDLQSSRYSPDLQHAYRLYRKIV